MSPLAGRRPDDQLSLRRASVPSGNPFGPAPGVQPEEQPGVERSMPYLRDFTLRGQHSPVRRRAGRRNRSVLGRGDEGQVPSGRWAGRGTTAAASSSILQALPTRPSRRSEMVGLEQVTAGALAPVPRSPRSPENAMAHFVQQNETPRHPAESHGPNLASTSPGRLHR